LRGINSKRKKLADGSFRTYYWAWKGEPPLRGEPGTPEFVASYNEAVARKVSPPTGVLQALSTLAMTVDTYGHLFAPDKDAHKRLADAERALRV
jgi:hypothetical protein